MKIIHITPAYKPAYIYGGPTMSVAKLCEALKEMDTDIEVLTTTANGAEELSVIPGKEVIVDGVSVTYYKRITKDHTHFSPALLIALWRKIRAEKNREQTSHHQVNELIIHIHSWWNLVALFGGLIAKILRVPIILSPRGMLTHYTQNNRNLVFKKIIHMLIGKPLLNYIHIFASSELEKEDILRIVKPKSITVIPNLVDLPFQNQRKKIKNIVISNKQSILMTSPVKLIFLSRIEEKKGLDLLFAALKNVKFLWQLTLGGTGESTYINHLKKLSFNFGIADKIDWIGYVSNEHKFDLISQHHLMILTSYNENFANIIIESLSVGTPVLISDQVGLANYVRKQGLGWVSTTEISSITKTLKNAVDHIKELKWDAEKAIKVIKGDYHTAVLAEKYISNYLVIINEQKRSLHLKS